jgi:hypothetical protein
MGLRWKDGYSAAVEVYLEADGQRYNVERVGDNNIVIRDACELQPQTSATLVIVVDGQPRRQRIFLHQGAAGNMLEPVPFF